MQCYQRGDSSAFEVLYRRHKGPLFNYLYNSCQNQALVEDLAHDVWLSIIRRIEIYQPNAAFRTYLYRIAWHKLVDHWRKNTNENGGSEFDEEIHSERDVQSQSHESSLRVDEILSAIHRLPIEQRTAFLLKEEGFSQQEIAEITETKPETVKSRLRYAQKTLRRFMEVMA